MSERDDLIISAGPPFRQEVSSELAEIPNAEPKGHCEFKTWCVLGYDHEGPCNSGTDEQRRKNHDWLCGLVERLSR